MRAALGSEFDGPEARGGAQEFEADERGASLHSYYARDAARQLFVGLRVGQQKFLGWGDFA
jgi:hypothetical protein